MTTASLPTVSGAPLATGAVAKLRWALADAWTVTRRNLIAYTRIPEALFFSTIQPVMFVLLFRFVFGGSIGHFTAAEGIPYPDYLMAGIFVQTMAFGSVSTSVGLAEDLQKGIIERFRALPMARSAVLAGRTTADLIRNVLVALIITGVGFAVGFRITTGVPEFLGGVALTLLFAYALSWGFAVIGLSASNSETAQVMAFPLLFPLTFASSAFVPVNTMPGWLQGFANHQPVSIVINAARSLMAGPKAAHLAGSTTTSLVIQAVIWCLVLLAVLAPLAVWRYRSRT
jgi:ABC-2 type transport system permease protein/oleandomycin transport system permease protein